MYKFICKCCGEEFEPKDLGRYCMDCIDQDYDVTRQCMLCKECEDKTC